jgi:hypothetical protein
VAPLPEIGKLVGIFGEAVDLGFAIAVGVVDELEIE